MGQAFIFLLEKFIFMNELICDSLKSDLQFIDKILGSFFIINISVNSNLNSCNLFLKLAYSLLKLISGHETFSLPLKLLKNAHRSKMLELIFK